MLEEEIRIKKKVVDDFSHQLETNTLDANLASHTMKNKKDILVLTRKLLGCLQHWGVIERREAIAEQPVEKKVDVMAATLPVISNEITVRIESATRLKNPINEDEPANTYVVFRSDLGAEFKTETIYRSSFPAWNATQRFDFPVNEKTKSILSEDFNFDVYHLEMRADGFGQAEYFHIGRCAVNVSNFIKVKGTDEISGYYHIQQGEEVKG